jgi:hypothetical protein
MFRTKMVLPSVPRPYVGTVVVLLVCSNIFYFWSPFSAFSASVPQYISYASGIEPGDLQAIYNDTLGVCTHCS